MNEKTLQDAVVNGLSSALASIAHNREESDRPDLNLTDEERLLIQQELLHYLKTSGIA